MEPFVPESQTRDLASGFTRGARQSCDPNTHGHNSEEQQQISTAMARPDEDPKLFEQCRVCIVCTDSLPLEAAQQVWFTPQLWSRNID